MTMHTKIRSDKGLSLIEATIILLVLATLTAVISPSMGDFLEDSRQMKVKEDVESLGLGIVRLLRDTGLKGLKLNGAVGFTEANRVDVVHSNDGSVPSNSSATYSDADVLGGTVAWWGTAGEDNDDTFENQLVHNFPDGDTDGSASYGIPTASNRGRGWRGSYLNSPPGADPWGYRYYSNTGFLTVATDSTVGSSEGDASGFWARDVVVLSAGPDNTIQTNIDGSGTISGGSGMATSNDDLIFVVQGNTR